MTPIILPWPPKELTPNGPQGNYRGKAAARSRQKSDAYYIAKQQETPSFPDGPIPLKITFCPPNNIRRDLDNMLAMSKGLVDGLCEAWRIDDARLRPITIDFGDVRKGGAVVVEVVK